MNATTSTFIYSDLCEDADLCELVELFVSEVPNRIQTMLHYAEQNDWEQLGRTAHQIKGAAGSYGFGSVTPMAAELEAACRGGKGEQKIQQALENLIDMCQRLRSGLPS